MTDLKNQIRSDVWRELGFSKRDIKTLEEGRNSWSVKEAVDLAIDKVVNHIGMGMSIKYNEVIRHRQKCPKWGKEYCVDCFGGGLSRFCSGVMKSFDSGFRMRWLGDDIHG